MVEHRTVLTAEHAASVFSALYNGSPSQWSSVAEEIAKVEKTEVVEAAVAKLVSHVVSISMKIKYYYFYVDNRQSAADAKNDSYLTLWKNGPVHLYCS